MLKNKDWLLRPHDCPGFLGTELSSQKTAGAQVHWTEILRVRIPSRYALVNITEHIEESLARSGITDGLCYVGAMHITAGVYVNDAESGLLSDIAKWIENLAPFGENYQHHQTGEDNGDAHLKSYLTNHQIMIPITDGRLHFGTWQQVFYAEFDGLREKRILLKMMGIA